MDSYNSNSHENHNFSQVDEELYTGADQQFMPEFEQSPAVDQNDDISLARIFVQIHQNAFDTSLSMAQHPIQPYQNNREEIKSEPIKSEMMEVHVAENLNTNQTAQPTQQHVEPEVAAPLITARPKFFGRCFKCSQCLFATLFEERLNDHVSNFHLDLEAGLDSAANCSTKKLLKCPACDNEFVVKEALRVHLELDHQMPLNEIQLLIDERSEAPTTENKEQTGEQRKSRIFIKSVDVLRMPQVKTPNVELVQSFENSYPADDHAEMITPDSQVDPLGTQTYNSPDSFKLDRAISIADENSSSNSSDRRTKAKIYIKNVDILKEPIFVSPAVPTNVLNTNDSLDLDLCASSLDIYDFNTNTTLKTTSLAKNFDLYSHPILDNVPRKAPNLLHLRTVDELNLMNMNEVHNLMAPLPGGEPNLAGHPSCPVLSSKNAKSSDDVLLLANQVHYQNFEFSYNQDSSFNVSESDLIPANWNNNYDFDELPNPGKFMASTPRSTHFDLNTPQQIENDEDILFVCTPDILNDNVELPSANDQSYVYEEENPRSVEVDQTEENSRKDIPEIFEILDDLEFESIPTPVAAVGAAGPPAVEFAAENVPEKGRIYVADNLLEDRSQKQQSLMVTTPPPASAVVAKRNGRPIGSKQTGITKLKKAFGNPVTADFGYHKCNMDCAYRFRDPAKLEYHKKCHTSSLQKMQCPECKKDEFTAWNTLHTHLWRNHKIDMELYSCQLCSFKTPILSRLTNTHVKIHSDARDFQCDQCEKAFKNAKQLKEHRRIHRRSSQPQQIHLCDECDSSFLNIRSLKDHIKRKHHANETPASNSTLTKPNPLEDGGSKYQCNKCTYSTNDHNVFRRHKMTHEATKQYQCKFCKYSCIHSSRYQKHIRNKHPEVAFQVILSCPDCKFTTISQTCYNVHVVKHRSTSVAEQSNGSEAVSLESSNGVGNISLDR